MKAARDPFLLLAKATARRLMPTRDAALRLELEEDDLVTGAYLAGYAAVGTFDPNRGAALKTWVLIRMRGAVSNQIKAALTRAKARKEHCALGVVADMADPEPGPEEAALWNETLLHLRRGVDLLPSSRREAVRLRYWEGMTFEAAARRMGVTMSRAHQLHGEAICRLRAWMTEG